MDKYLDLERFLSEIDRRATHTARGLYADDPVLSERLAKLVREIRETKAEVVRKATGTATAA